MSTDTAHVFFATELEGVATFWRILRTDGVTLGFIGHDRDLRFGGILHRAAPGILPASLRKTDRIDGDSAEMQGPLGHWSIDSDDLAQGRFDNAQVQMGAVDWETLDTATLFHGTLGAVSQDDGTFVAELQSAKAALDIDTVPRTSPTCRAEFCGPGCTLSPARFTHQAGIVDVDGSTGSVRVSVLGAVAFQSGELRWMTGPSTGRQSAILDVEDGWLRLHDPLPDMASAIGTTVSLREGCDHTLATCTERFGNAVNFQGEPFLPGNDLLARYAVPG